MPEDDILNTIKSWNNLQNNEKNMVLKKMSKSWDKINPPIGILKELLMLLEKMTDADMILPALINLWEKFKRPQKEMILRSLAKSSEKNIELWNKLTNAVKAELLELFSRKYTMAHAVFAARLIAEKHLKDTKVYIQLNEPEKTLEEYGSEKIGRVIAKECSENGKKELSIRIYYWCPSQETVKYDKRGYISEDCNRFIVSHELAHVILHLDYLVEILDCNRFRWHSSRYNSHNQETEADNFAKILSDLRDRHILKYFGHDSNIPSKKAIAKSYGNIKPEIIEKAIELDDLSEKFTMSNSIFAAKEIVSAIYESQDELPDEDNIREKLEQMQKDAKKLQDKKHGVQIYPAEGTERQDCVSIVPFLGIKGKLAGYFIALPKQNISKSSEDIAKTLCAFLLDYEKIREQNVQIFVNEENFGKGIGEFSDVLLKTRKSNIQAVAGKMKSRERILSLFSADES